MEIRTAKRDPRRNICFVRRITPLVRERGRAKRISWSSRGKGENLRKSVSTFAEEGNFMI